jgi:hypothetical protein
MNSKLINIYVNGFEKQTSGANTLLRVVCFLCSGQEHFPAVLKEQETHGAIVLKLIANFCYL